MKQLSKGDQNVLRLLSEGVSDHEICVKLRLTVSALSKSLHRIEQRAAIESDDAGRFFERALKQRAQRKITSLEARFRALMDVLPQAVIVIDGRTGAIKEFNQIACDLFGYSRQELLGLSVENLVPSGFRTIHARYRLGFLASIRKREMGYHPPIFGVRRDGTQVEMAIALTATATDDDVMVVCSEHTQWVVSQANREKEQSS